MNRKESVLLLLILMLSISLVLALSFPLLEYRVAAQNETTGQVLNAEELRIVDKEGRTRIRLGVDEMGSYIEIIDRNGDVEWNAPSSGWLESGVSGAARVYTGVGGNHWVQTVLEQGGVVILGDGSRWEVEPLSQTTTVLWAPTSPITVARADSPIDEFEYTLTNTEDSKSVRAKFGRQR